MKQQHKHGACSHPMRKLIRKKTGCALVPEENHRVVEQAVLRIRIRIRRIRMFLGLPDQDPLVRDMDPDMDPDPGQDPSNIK